MPGLNSTDKRLSNIAKNDGWEAFRRAYSAEYPDAGADAGINDAYYEYMDLDTNRSVRRKDRNERGPTGNNADAPDNLAGWIKAGLATQYRDNDMAPREFQDMESVMGLLVDEQGRMMNVREILGNALTDVGMAIVLNFSQQNDLLMKINERTGMLGTMSRTFREEITEAYPHAIKLGISFEELTESVTKLVTDSGKFRLLGEDTIREMALASKFAEDMEEYAAMAGNFERVSYGILDMTRETSKAGLSAMAVGLNARTTVSMINENLNMLNQYGFRRGIEGLTEMAKKSIEFRMNINAASRLAENVWSPEGALEVVSNLQVLGGAVGALNDPLKLMYMATNNIEGLQDAIINASKSLVTYNNEQGRFEVTGANLRRAKEMAKELGMEMGELTTTAVASMERTQAASDLMSRGFNMDDEDMEFLTNIAQMKEGKMVIEVPKSLADSIGTETSIALEDMSEGIATVLLDQREELKGKEMIDVALEQVSLIENINRDVSFITASMRIQSTKLLNDAMAAGDWDPEKAAKQASDIAESLGGKFDTELLYDAINSRFGTNLKHQTVGVKPQPEESYTIPESKTETTPAESAPQHSTLTTNSTLRITTNANMYDDLGRLIANDKEHLSMMRDSFLEKLGR